MKKFLLIVASLFIALFSFSQDTLPQFKFSGNLKATNYLFTPAITFPTLADINGDDRPDLILGTLYSLDEQSLYSLVFTYDPANDDFVYLDTLRDEQGKIILGVAPFASDINFDDTLDLIITPNPYYNYTFRYKMMAPNRFKFVDTVKYTTGIFDQTSIPYALFDGNRDSLADLYGGYLNSIEYHPNIGDTIFGNYYGYDIVDSLGYDISLPDDAYYLNFYKNNKIDRNELLVSCTDGKAYSYLMLDSLHFNFSGPLRDDQDSLIKGDMFQALADTIVDGETLDLFTFSHFFAPMRYRLTDSGWHKIGRLTARDYYLQTYYDPDICFYDINNDGQDDAFMSDVNGHILRFLRNGEDLYFGLPDSLRVDGKPLELGNPIHFAINDIDDDGSLDLFVSPLYSGYLLYYRQQQGLNFALVDTILNAGQRLSPTINDFDGSTPKELAVSMLNTGNIVFYHFNDNALEVLDTIQSYAYYPIIASGDIDNDGDNDIFIVYSMNYINDAVEFLMNDGEGNFTLADSSGYTTSIFIGTNNFGVAATDLDGDGKADMVLSQGFGNVVYWKNKTPHSSGIEEFKKMFTVYPNPATDILYLGTKTTYTALYQITDLQGRIIKNGLISSGENKLDISDLQSGVYILHLQYHYGKSRYTKFIKL